MHFVEHLSVASALISLAFGSPIEKRGVDFSIKQTVPKPFIKSGPAAVAAVYKKYDATAPADVSQPWGCLLPFSRVYPSRLCRVTEAKTCLCINIEADPGFPRCWPPQLPAMGLYQQLPRYMTKSTLVRCLSEDRLLTWILTPVSTFLSISSHSWSS